MTTNQLLLDAPQHHGHPISPAADSIGYHLRLASTADDVLAAQQLRADVGTLERRPGTPQPDSFDGRELDDQCDHLIVWHRAGTGMPQAVATCRLLPPHGNDSAPRGSGLDANRSFGLMPLERLLDSTVEVGGVCVRIDHRTGTAVSLLFNGVARYLHLTGYRYLLAAVPMDLRDDGRNAASFWDFALTGHLARAERRCRPRDPIAIGGLERAVPLLIPVLLSCCLRLGAKVCGPPGYDESLGAAAFLVLLDTEDVNPRHQRRLLNSDG